MQSPKKTTNIKDALRTKAGLAVETAVEPVVQEDAVEAGRKPLSARRSDLAAMRAKALELYGIRDGASGIPAIDAAFRFSSDEFDGQWNYLHVEPLLDRSSELLGRCLSHRSKRDAIQLEKWKFQLELDRFLRIDPLAQREREAGGDTIAYERAVRESAAEQSLEENHRHAGEQLRDLTSDLVTTGLNRRMAARELAAWMSAWPLKDGDLRGDNANYTFDGARKTKPEHLFDAARQEADQDGWEQIYTLTSQRYAAAAESDAARLRRESLELQAKLSLASIAFRREMAQAERDSVWEMVHEVLSPGSVLNYQERIAAVEREFNADFREALACLASARHGLQELYAYAPVFPKEGSAGYLDNVTDWVRRAQSRTAQISRNDQNYVLALSVKQLTGSQWEAGRAASSWTFDLPEETFAGQSKVRLRGMSVSVTGPLSEPQQLPKGASPKVAAPAPKSETLKAEGFWSARVTPPATGTMRSTTGAPRELDQKSLPSCFLGCVTDSGSLPQEIAGAEVLYNASPIGKQWKLTLSPKSTDGMETAKLQDVQIMLHLAVHAMVSL